MHYGGQKSRSLGLLGIQRIQIKTKRKGARFYGVGNVGLAVIKHIGDHLVLQMRADDEVALFWRPPILFNLLIGGRSVSPRTGRQNGETIGLPHGRIVDLAHMELFDVHLFARLILEPVHH